MYERVAIPSPWMGMVPPLCASMMNLGMAFSGYWCGPYTLLPRVMMYGRLYDLP